MGGHLLSAWSTLQLSSRSPRSQHHHSLQGLEGTGAPEDCQWWPMKLLVASPHASPHMCHLQRPDAARSTCEGAPSYTASSLAARSAQWQANHQGASHPGTRQACWHPWGNDDAPLCCHTQPHSSARPSEGCPQRNPHVGKEHQSLWLELLPLVPLQTCGAGRSQWQPRSLHCREGVHAPPPNRHHHLAALEWSAASQTMHFSVV
mmetsp:Transcript_20193/g.47086  ORF Transcript_20193/g.47086 Transcript_20193/m.47086 type:complete len:205 (-) Transcript_20193:1535-2149(-)